MRASAGGHSDVVQVLLSAGASLDEKDIVSTYSQWAMKLPASLFALNLVIVLVERLHVF